MISRRDLLATAAAAALGGGTSVRHLGARGDGATDDTAALQAALRAGGAVYLPPGDYVVTAPLVADADRPLELAGAGAASTIRWGFDGDLLRWDGRCRGVTIRDLRIVPAAHISPGSTAVLCTAGCERTTFQNLLLEGAGSGFLLRGFTQMVSFVNCLLVGVTGTGIELGHGNEVRVIGGRIVGADPPGRGRIGLHLTGDNGGVHIVETDLISHAEGCRIENLGAGSNREVFVTHATFDSCARGLVVADASYVSVAGLWAASCDRDNVWIGDGAPLVVVNGGTIFNGAGNGMTVRSGSFVLHGVAVRANRGHGLDVADAVRDHVVTGCRFTENGVGAIVRGRGYVCANNVYAHNHAPSRFLGRGRVSGNVGA